MGAGDHVDVALGFKGAQIALLGHAAFFDLAVIGVAGAKGQLLVGEHELAVGAQCEGCAHHDHVKRLIVSVHHGVGQGGKRCAIDQLHYNWFRSTISPLIKMLPSLSMVILDLPQVISIFSEALI
jgi:hypothetical protein